MNERTLEVSGFGGPVSLAVAEAGAGGRPLLLVHGFTGAKEDFTYHEGWVDRVAAKGWHVVAPDHRGHGESDHPEEESAYSFDLMAGDMLALVDALGWDRFALLGHSMGGMVAQVMALTAGDRLTGLVLMDTSHGPLEGLPQDQADAMIAIARERGMPFLADLMADRDSPLDTPAARRLKETRPGWKEFERDKFARCSAAMCASMIAAFHSTADRLDDLAGVNVPTLVIVGEQDKPFLAPSERMAKTIPGARLEVIPDAGHSPQFEAPGAWWKALASFLDDLSLDDGAEG